AVFRFYRTVAATLTGQGRNAGGVIALAGTRPAQVGVGADQGNLRCGLYAELAASVTSQPAGRTLTPGGTPTLRINFDRLCILPPPQQTPDLVMTVDNVTHGYALLTGTDLAWLNGLTIGPALISSTDPRSWVNGYLTVRSNTQVEVHPPQALPLGTYPTRAFSPAGDGGTRQLTLTAPAVPRMATQSDRFGHENQDWVISQGNLQAPVVGCLALSPSNLPSSVPGVIDLGIGAQFANLLVLPGTFALSPASGAVVIHVPDMPPTLQGLRLYCQAAVLELNNPAV